jgi:Protein of unknown function (DUF2867)
MGVVSVSPDPSTRPLLAGAGFADAFCLVVDEPALDAISASHRVFARTPGWVSRLLWLRNLLVAPLGLRQTSSKDRTPLEMRIGFFPVVSQSGQRVVLGFNDKHLDFRVIVDAAPSDGGSRITATTLVRQHNPMGRIYLALVLPFHRIIVPAMLAQAARP